MPNFTLNRPGEATPPPFSGKRKGPPVMSGPVTRPKNRRQSYSGRPFTSRRRRHQARRTTAARAQAAVKPTNRYMPGSLAAADPTPPLGMTRGMIPSRSVITRPASTIPHRRNLGHQSRPSQAGRCFLIPTTPEGQSLHRLDRFRVLNAADFFDVQNHEALAVTTLDCYGGMVLLPARWRGNGRARLAENLPTQAPDVFQRGTPPPFSSSSGRFPTPFRRGTRCGAAR